MVGRSFVGVGNRRIGPVENLERGRGVGGGGVQRQARNRLRHRNGVALDVRCQGGLKGAVARRKSAERRGGLAAGDGHRVDLTAFAVRRGNPDLENIATRKEVDLKIRRIRIGVQDGGVFGVEETPAGRLARWPPRP